MRWLTGLAASIAVLVSLESCTNDYDRYKFPKGTIPEDAGNTSNTDAPPDAALDAADAD